jgi:DNA ligase-3
MLPFGTLGKHKKKQFKEANVCLFVFDLLWHNGESLLDKPLRERRKLLEEMLHVIPLRVEITE